MTKQNSSNSESLNSTDILKSVVTQDSFKATVIKATENLVQAINDVFLSHQQLIDYRPAPAAAPNTFFAPTPSKRIFAGSQRAELVLKGIQSALDEQMPSRTILAK